MIDKKNQINGLANVQCIKTELLKKLHTQDARLKAVIQKLASKVIIVLQLKKILRCMLIFCRLL